MPLCPRGHGSRQIVFGGRYGQGLGKQLYKCYPANGSRPHRFAPLLPRLGMPEHTCWECGNPIYAHVVPGQSVNWLDFAYLFSLLPGTPQGFTADHGNGVLNAVSAWWHGIELSASIHHARKGCINAVPPLIWTRYGPQTQAIADALESLLDFAAKKTGQYQPVKAWFNAVIGGAGAN